LIHPFGKKTKAIRNVNEVRQKTVEELRQTLEFDDIRVNGSKKQDSAKEFNKAYDTKGGTSLKDKVTQKMAQQVAQVLSEEISKGILEVESYDQRIIIRLLDHSAFESGLDLLQQEFIPILNKIRKILKVISGKIVVEGHTDDIPIYNSRFRSNWELSAARAASVVRVLLENEVIRSTRVSLSSFADTRPLFPNDSRKNRRRNRRVEIILEQGGSPDYKNLDEFDLTKEIGAPGWVKKRTGTKSTQLDYKKAISDAKKNKVRAKNLKKLNYTNIITPEGDYNKAINQLDPTPTFKGFEDVFNSQLEKELKKNKDR